MEIVLASPRGYCAGVDRAIDVVTIALDQYGPPVYVRHENVHNRHVVDFIQWHWRDHYWPAFNVADAAIVGGAIGIVLFGLLERKPRDP
jgi:hypothetical protein